MPKKPTSDYFPAPLWMRIIFAGAIALYPVLVVGLLVVMMGE